MNHNELTLEIARSFPCLQRKIRNWSPKEFQPDAFQALASGWSHGEQLCVLFVLNVWNSDYAKEKAWHFDFMEFAGTADPDSRAALSRWLANPRWP